jgi:predicted amino acid racemase
VKSPGEVYYADIDKCETSSGDGIPTGSGGLTSSVVTLPEGISPDIASFTPGTAATLGWKYATSGIEPRLNEAPVDTANKKIYHAQLDNWTDDPQFSRSRSRRPHQKLKTP